jgi:hypothetical protein
MDPNGNYAMIIWAAVILSIEYRVFENSVVLAKLMDNQNVR